MIQPTHKHTRTSEPHIIKIVYKIKYQPEYDFLVLFSRFPQFCAVMLWCLCLMDCVEDEDEDDDVVVVSR